MEASGHEQEVTPKNQTHHDQIRSAPARSGARQSRGFEQSHQPRRPTRLSSCHRRIRRLVLFRTAFSVEPDSGLTLILSFGIPTTRSWHNQPPPRGRAPVSNRILEAVVLRKGCRQFAKWQRIRTVTSRRICSDSSTGLGSNRRWELLVTQRNHWIHTDRPPCRNVRRQERGHAVGQPAETEFAAWRLLIAIKFQTPRKFQAEA